MKFKTAKLLVFTVMIFLGAQNIVSAQDKAEGSRHLKNERAAGKSAVLKSESTPPASRFERVFRLAAFDENSHGSSLEFNLS